VRVKAEAPRTRFRRSPISALAKAYLELNHLKQLYRQGWLQRGVPAERCESVAEHTFGVAALALLLAQACFPALDRDRLLRMAVLHEFGEIRAGDLTPQDGVPAEEKRRREAASVGEVLADLPGGDELIRLWEEYASGATPEARFLREVDRLEMGLQAVVYESQGLADLAEFHETVDRALSTPELRALFRELETASER